MPNDGMARPAPHRGDQVNTLVLVNNSTKPLLLLAGEIVTGGKQDRVIAKDRIVPAGSDPIDLGVFCIEPGRWTEDTANFHASAKAPAQSMMVQPMCAKKPWSPKTSTRSGIRSMAPLAALSRRKHQHPRTADRRSHNRRCQPWNNQLRPCHAEQRRKRQGR